MPKVEATEARSGEPLARLFASHLREGEIHLWGISLDSDPALLERCVEALTDVERKRISYYAFKDVQRSNAISQGGLRLLLSYYLNMSPQGIHLERHAKGKPYTPDDRSLCFNISNSGKHCIYAFSRAGEVGVDIEEVRPLPDLQPLIDTNFTDREKDYINRIPENRSARFFQFWTVKEAYLKAIGEGMRLTPDSLEFSVDSKCFRLESVKGVQEHEDWQCKVFTPAPRYAGAIVHKGTQTKVNDLEFI